MEHSIIWKEGNTQVNGKIIGWMVREPFIITTKKSLTKENGKKIGCGDTVFSTTNNPGHLCSPLTILTSMILTSSGSDTREISSMTINQGKELCF
jgi:hypothetical protein